MPALLPLVIASSSVVHAAAADGATLGHPRLYFTQDDLPRLRRERTRGVRKRIWRNLAASADWCLTQTPRTEWIAPVSPDPVYLNLYDRFYAMMHDMAVMEHLAFAYAYSGDARYLEGGRQWALACCRVWRHEADGTPDASKAYAVMRLLKGLAVSYDILYAALREEEREEIRGTLATVGAKYFQWYLDNPGMAGPDQDKHHGSVEAASFGVAALALLGEVPEAKDWLDLMVRKHTEYLLPHALTASGTQADSSNFWASTMHYRLFFLDALRRVTRQDLFREYERFMNGRMALAAAAWPEPPDEGRPWIDESQQSVLFGPSYGQLDYWSLVPLYLAREYRRPIYQHLARWDRSLGAIQAPRYITPNGEQLLFELGGYAYAWYDPSVRARIEPGLPLSFAFEDVNEAYARSSYRRGAIVAGVRRGRVVIHAGGRPVFIDLGAPHAEPPVTPSLSLTDDGKSAIIRCNGAAEHGFTEETVELVRPGRLTITRTTDEEVRWWCQGRANGEGNVLRWPDGTSLRVVQGSLTGFEPQGFQEEFIVGMGKLKCVDPTPVKHPLVTAQPGSGVVRIEVTTRQP